MAFDPMVAETRFGYGLAPALEPPGSVEGMLRGLTDVDEMAHRFEIQAFPEFFARIGARRQLKRRLQTANVREAVGLKRQIKAINRSARSDYMRWLGMHILRRTHTRTGFRERLECFWANHFTAMGKSIPIRYGAPPYIESAIRPNLAGRFSELVIAAVTHPLMLHYLDQKRSVGPASRTGQATRKGLNENLAREVLELHTLGAAGPYSQADVRGLAELMTGLSSEPTKGLVFRADQAQPGQKQILGEAYEPVLSDVFRALEEIARHPATARHVCGKLARYFLSDAPPKDLTDAMEEAFLSSGGALIEVYHAMLSHDAAWAQDTQKLRLPFDYVASACRGLTVAPEQIEAMTAEAMDALFAGPLAQMGQDWLRPKGPDGFPLDTLSWATPPGMAARLNWALTVPRQLTPDLPDPRTLLRNRLDQPAATAIAAAESRAHGLAIYFLSPAFQKV